MLDSPNKAQRLANIESKIEEMLGRNENEVGTGKSVSEIETTLLSELLGIGQLMMADRLLEEEAALESRGYDISCSELQEEGEAKKKSS